LTVEVGPSIGEEGARRLRLAVVDDHEVFRVGLRNLLSRLPAFEVAWDTGSPHEAFERLRNQAVEVVLMDINLGGPMDGVEATRRLVATWPQLKVILISGLADQRRLASARQAGASGFLPKELSADEMVRAIERMVAGDEATGANAGAHDGSSRSSHDGFDDPAALEDLTPRELDVLAEMRHARTNREIAARLGVSTTTVNKHVHQVLRKLGVRNRAEAAIVAATLLSRPRDVF
jgi:DNA-binding NarL/FixJ family response regulator